MVVFVNTAILLESQRIWIGLLVAGGRVIDPPLGPWLVVGAQHLFAVGRVPSLRLIPRSGTIDNSAQPFSTDPPHA